MFGYKVLGFADVKHFALIIKHAVDARALGQIAEKSLMIEAGIH